VLGKAVRPAPLQTLHGLGAVLLRVTSRLQHLRAQRADETRPHLLQLGARINIESAILDHVLLKLLARTTLHRDLLEHLLAPLVVLPQLDQMRL